MDSIGGIVSLKFVLYFSFFMHLARCWDMDITIIGFGVMNARIYFGRCSLKFDARSSILCLCVGGSMQEIVCCFKLYRLRIMFQYFGMFVFNTLERSFVIMHGSRETVLEVLEF